MKRRTLSLLVCAAAAVLALAGASSASASKFTASKIGAKVTEQTLKNYVFTITGNTIGCTNYNIAEETEHLETESIQGTTEISGCTAFGFAATFTNKGCEFTMNAGGEGKLLGSECELILTVNVPFIAKCKGNVKPQSVANAASFTNVEGDVRVTANLSGIDAEVTESTGACPMTVGKHTDATLTGESTVKAEGATIAWDK